MKEAADKGAVLDIAAVPKEIVLARVLKSKNRVVREVPCDAGKLLKNWRVNQQEICPLPLSEESLVFSVPERDGGRRQGFAKTTLILRGEKLFPGLMAN